MAEQELKPFNYGGQAVIEGVMMRGQYVAAIAVRNSKGEIVVRELPLNATVYRGRAARLPFVRGLVMLWDSLGLGTKALMWSAGVAQEEEEVQVSLEGAAGMGLVVVSMALGIGLFFLIPAAAAAAVKEALDVESRFSADMIEGLSKLGMLTGYIWLIGHMQDVKRLFGYHGAEHKTINAYEAGAELTPDEVAAYPIEHPRCGTAFLLTLVVLSVLIHTATGRPDKIYWLLASRLGLILPIAGLAYEYIRFTAKHQTNPIIRLISRPNLWLQKLTTREPDPKMLEVGIAALQHVLAAERAGKPVTAESIETLAPAGAAVPSGD